MWLCENKLTPSVEKTKLMFISPKKVGLLPDIYFNNQKLEWVSSIKYLGIIIDRGLNFIKQSQEVFKDLSKAYGTIYAISKFMPQSVLLKIYYAIVYPKLTQNVILWGGIKESNKANIKILINKILRSILLVKTDQNHRPLMHTDEMYKSLGLLKFDDIYQYYLLRFIHFAFHGNETIFHEHFQPLIPSHDYPTRDVRILIPKARLEIEKQSVIYQCCNLYNEIPQSFLEVQKTSHLKNNFKKFCIDRYL